MGVILDEYRTDRNPVLSKKKKSTWRICQCHQRYNMHRIPDSPAYLTESPSLEGSLLISPYFLPLWNTTSQLIKIGQNKIIYSYILPYLENFRVSLINKELEHAHFKVLWMIFEVMSGFFKNTSKTAQTDNNWVICHPQVSNAGTFLIRWNAINTQISKLIQGRILPPATDDYSWVDPPIRHKTPKIKKN